MKFFVPKVTEAQKAEEFYQAVVERAKRSSGYEILPNRVFRLWARHEGSLYKYEVGQEEEKNGKKNGDLVFVVIETAGLFLTYSRDRGIAGSEGPILTGSQDVVDIEYFEDYKPS